MQLKLECGDKLTDIECQVVFSDDSLLSDLIYKRTFLVFSRFWGCSLCQLDLQEYKERYQDFKNKDVNIIVVLQSQKSEIEEQTKDKPFPYPIVCDPDEELYKLYGVIPAKNKLGLASGRAISKLLKAKEKGIQSGKKEGNPLQLPAYFLMNQHGIIEIAHYGKDAGDIPAVEDMLEML